MSIHYAPGKRTASGTVRIIVSLGIGIVAAFAAGAFMAWYASLLLAWDTAVIVYLSWMWLTLVRLKENQTKNFAVREDPSRGIIDFVLISPASRVWAG